MKKRLVKSTQYVQLEKKHYQSAITLIALVVTIVVLLILAGVSITLLWGENGIFKQAEEGSLQYQIAAAREKLDATLSNAQMQKRMNIKYDLNKLIEDNTPNTKVLGEIVVTDGFAFYLDRETPKIGEYACKESELVFPELSVQVNKAENLETATIVITAKEEKIGINKIEILFNGTVIETYQYSNKTEEIVENYTVGQNGDYTINVYSNIKASKQEKIEGLITVTHLTLDKKVATDNRTATITITAQESKKGISKIEVIANGKVVKEYEYNKEKEQIIQNYTAEQNTTYTVKVYAEPNAIETIEISGLIRIAVGDYVDYTPDEAEDYSFSKETTGAYNNWPLKQDKTAKWIIMSINNDNTIDLISEKPVGSSNIQFKGAVGFNNVVYLLNDVCRKQYSNGKFGITARSVNLQDIENTFSTKGIEARNAYTSYEAGIQYGNSKTYTSSTADIYYPDIYNKVTKDTIGESNEYYAQPTTDTTVTTKSLSVKQTFYNFNTMLLSYFTEDSHFHIFFGGENAYFLATRYADNYTNKWCHFGVRKVVWSSTSNMLTLGTEELYRSLGSNWDATGNIRPVVHLPSNVKVSEEGGTAENPKSLSK